MKTTCQAEIMIYFQRLWNKIKISCSLESNHILYALTYMHEMQLIKMDTCMWICTYMYIHVYTICPTHRSTFYMFYLSSIYSLNVSCNLSDMIKYIWSFSPYFLMTAEYLVITSFHIVLITILFLFFSPFPPILNIDPGCSFA